MLQQSITIMITGLLSVFVFLFLLISLMTISGKVLGGLDAKLAKTAGVATAGGAKLASIADEQRSRKERFAAALAVSLHKARN